MNYTKIILNGSLWWLILSTWQYLGNPRKQTPMHVCEGINKLSVLGRSSLNVGSYFHELWSWTEWKEESELVFCIHLSVSWLCMQCNQLRQAPAASTIPSHDMLYTMTDYTFELRNRISLSFLKIFPLIFCHINNYKNVKAMYSQFTVLSNMWL